MKYYFAALSFGWVALFVGMACGKVGTMTEPPALISAALPFTVLLFLAVPSLAAFFAGWYFGKESRQ